MSDLLRLEYIPLDTVVLWDENPKRHDVGVIMASINKYGFKDPPKYEPELNGGKGGLAEGNGRTHCLRLIRASDNGVPRGILVKDGVWCVPVLFGVDAESEAIAQAYAIDHNNSVMSGGDYTPLDMEKMWDPGYTDIAIAVNPITVSGEVVEAMLANESSLANQEFLEKTNITITIPRKYKDQVKDFLAFGEKRSMVGLGLGVLKRMEHENAMEAIDHIVEVPGLV